MYCEKYVRYVICSFIFVTATLATIGCVESDEEEQAAKTAIEFADHFFNYELKEAASLATDDSQKWINFFASNVDEATINLIRNQQENATITIDDITINTPTMATATITANNFVWSMGGIKDSAIVIEKARFTLYLRKENEKWRIRMDSLPQSERQSRD